MVQVQMCREAPPKLVRFHQVQEGLWHSADGRQQLRCTGRFTCILRRRTARGRQETLYGLWDDRKIFLRQDHGPILEVRITLLPGGERMDWGRARVILPPAPDPLDSVSVEYSPNTHEFHSRDGRLVGRINLGSGRLQCDDRGPEWAGLAGSGLAVLVGDGHRPAVFRVTAVAHATFLLEGGGGFFRDEVAS